MAKRYTLIGPHAGRTVKLGKYQFTNGEYLFDGSDADSLHLSNILASFYSAYPDDKLAWARAQYEEAQAAPVVPPVQSGLSAKDQLLKANGLRPEDPAAQAIIAAAEQKTKDDAAAAQKLKDDAAAEQKLKDDAAAEQKLKDDAAAEQKLKDDAAAEQKLKDDAAAEQKLKDDAAAEQKLKDDAAAAEVAAAAAAAGKTALVAVLKQLDHTNDEHWTNLGLPEVKAVEALAGHAVSRKEIDEAAKGFNRKAAAEAAADPLA